MYLLSLFIQCGWDNSGIVVLADEVTHGEVAFAEGRCRGLVDEGGGCLVLDGHVSHPVVSYPVGAGIEGSDVEQCFLCLVELLFVKLPDAVDDDLSDQDLPVWDERVDGSPLASSVKDGQVAVDGIRHFLWRLFCIGLSEGDGGIDGLGQKLLAFCPG